MHDARQDARQREGVGAERARRMGLSRGQFGRGVSAAPRGVHQASRARAGHEGRNDPPGSGPGVRVLKELQCEMLRKKSSSGRLIYYTISAFFFM